MHKAIKIPEILHLTFQYTDTDTNVACARVCRTWHSPALDVVWHTITEPVALFCLLGPMKRNDDDECYFTQPHIAPERWTRFFFYATRTRRLYLTSDDYHYHPHVSATIALARPTIHILPNLIHLECDRSTSVFSTLFLCPTLKSFSVLLEDSPTSDYEEAQFLRPFTESELLTHVVERAPHLEHLEFHTEFQTTPKFQTILENALSNSNLHTLRSVALGGINLTPGVLSILGRCPLLEVIKRNNYFFNVATSEFIPPSFQSGAFPSLTEICFYDISLTNFSMLLQPPFPAARLRRLSVLSRDKETPNSISQLFNLVGSCCFSLQTLNLTAHHSLTNPVPRLPYEVLLFRVLKPLMACTELIELSIETSMAFDISNEELAQLAGALPRIRKLYLTPQPTLVTSHFAQLTLGVLPLLAQVRPEIQELGICIHPTLPTPFTSGDLGPFPLMLENLEDLVLGTDRMFYVPDNLAFCLAEATPPMCVVRTPQVPTRSIALKEVVERLDALIKMVLTIRKVEARYEKRMVQRGKRIEELES